MFSFNDFQDSLQEETRQKLSLQSKLRASQDEKERLEERLEEEEENKRAHEKQIMEMNQKVFAIDFHSGERIILIFVYFKIDSLKLDCLCYRFNQYNFDFPEILRKWMGVRKKKIGPKKKKIIEI